MAMKYIKNRMSDGRFVPKFAHTFPFEQIVDAYKYVLTNEQIGNVIISCS